jgi:hypothetical protein
MYIPVSLIQASEVKYHVFCDASEKAIAAVMYVTVREGSTVHSGFIKGQSKVAPSSANTIPRLELCSAVLAVELWQLVSQHLAIAAETHFYTDSKVVLGYISNETAGSTLT